MSRLSYAHLHTPDAAVRMVEYYLKQEAFAFDVETTGEHRGQPVVAPVSWISFATEGHAVAVPLGHPHGELVAKAHTRREKFFTDDVLTKTGKPKTQYRSIKEPAVWTPAPPQIDPDAFWEITEPLFLDERVKKIAHNAKFDLKAVAKYLGQPPAPPYEDTMGMAHLIDENALKGLKPLVERGNRLFPNNPRHFPGYGHKYDHEGVGKCVEKYPFSKVCRYAHLDAAYTYWLWQDLGAILAGNPDAMEVYLLEMDLYAVLLDMELEGQVIDVPRMEALARSLSVDVHDAMREVFAEAGEVFDIGSNATLSDILYNKRGHVPTVTSKKTGKPSVSKAALEPLADVDPLVSKILDYRSVKKLVSTYVGVVTEDGSIEGGLYGHLHNGRIHTDFRPFGTVTGRFSSASPNLQNIPRRGERASTIRSMFIPPAGETMVVADYSQIEYRVLAFMCKDETLTKAFIDGYDPHAAVAAMLLGKSIEDLLAEERDLGKTFNFAQIYGAGDARLAATLGISVAKVRAFRKQYAKDFPRIGEFSKYVVDTARSRRPAPYVTTILGRRRHLPELLWKSDEARATAERQAVNSLIQGSSADIIKVAMLDVADAIAPEPTWRLTLTVHDELALCVPTDDAKRAAKTLQTTMEAIDLIGDIPLVAEAAYGATWADAK